MDKRFVKTKNANSQDYDERSDELGQDEPPADQEPQYDLQFQSIDCQTFGRGCAISTYLSQTGEALRP